MASGENKLDCDLSQIYTDGAMNKSTGAYAWASVVNAQGVDLVECYKDCTWTQDLTIEHKPMGPWSKYPYRYVILVKCNDVATQQNNGAELVSMLFALRIVKHVGIASSQLDFSKQPTTVIYSDSQVILGTWSHGFARPTTWQKMDPVKKQWIQECGQLRKEFESRGGSIQYIPGGMNIADMGHHKPDSVVNNNQKLLTNKSSSSHSTKTTTFTHQTTVNNSNNNGTHQNRKRSHLVMLSEKNNQDDSHTANGDSDSGEPSKKNYIRSSIPHIPAVSSAISQAKEEKKSDQSTLHTL